MNRQLPYDRAERVANEVLHFVSRALIHELSDPRIRGVRITRVRMTPDLRIARISFHLREQGGAKRAEAEAGLASARGFVRRRIGEEIQLRYVPEVQFYYDEGVDAQERIEELLDDLQGDDDAGL